MLDLSLYFLPDVWPDGLCMSKWWYIIPMHNDKEEENLFLARMWMLKLEASLQEIVQTTVMRCITTI